MGSLRIKWAITYSEVIATEYELQGNVCCTEDVYYNVASEQLSMSYPNRPYLLANEPFTVWCARKVDFSGMANNEVKNVYEKGKITNFTDMSIRKTANIDDNALQCVTWSDHMLAKMYYQQHFRAISENSTRKKLPPYLLVSDLAQLRENVFFYYLWANHKTDNTFQLSGINNKYLVLTFNLFNSEKDDEFKL